MRAFLQSPLMLLLVSIWQEHFWIWISYINFALVKLNKSFCHIVMQTLVAVMQPDAFRVAFALEKMPVTIVFFHFIWKESGFKGRWWDSGQFNNIAKFELGLNPVPFGHDLRKGRGGYFYLLQDSKELMLVQKQIVTHIKVLGRCWDWGQFHNGGFQLEFVSMYVQLYSNTPRYALNFAQKT